jgi:hypothetical protein
VSQELEILRANAKIELDKLEAHATAREVAAKTIGKQALLWIFLLVLVGVGSSLALAPEALAPVIGLVATATMALIQMVTGIVTEAKKEEKPEITIIKELIARLDQKEPPMNVSVEGEKVIVSKGHDTITTTAR